MTYNMTSQTKILYIVRVVVVVVVVVMKNASNIENWKPYNIYLVIRFILNGKIVLEVL